MATPGVTTVDISSDLFSLSGCGNSKLRKKLARSIAVLRRHEPSFSLALFPTKTLYVGNGGAACGLSSKDVYEAFGPVGALENVSLPSNKPYCLITFENLSSSVRCVEMYQGKRPTEKFSQSPVYLLYLDFCETKNCGTQPCSSSTFWPPGLNLLNDFIDSTHECDLIKFAETLVSNENAEGLLKHRKVFHFGYKFLYETNTVDLKGRAPRIPDEFQPLISRIWSTGLILHRPDQLTINVYDPGQGIPLHVDTHSSFQDSIISLSLSSGVNMELKNAVTDQICSIFVPKRSLLIMTGECRYSWKHGTALWNGVETFLSALPEYSLVLDAGCGNGKYLQRKDNLIKIGCDRCVNLCKVANEKCANSQVFVADTLSLPVMSNAFDAVISIAVIHHLSTKDRRRHAIIEILRTLSSGGKALIYVWAFEQEYREKRSIYLKKENQDEKEENVNRDEKGDADCLTVHVNGTKFQKQDLLVPWIRKSNGVETFYRFYHVFVENELLDMCRELHDQCKIVEVFYEQGNWCVILEKL